MTAANALCAIARRSLLLMGAVLLFTLRTAPAAPSLSDLPRSARLAAEAFQALEKKQYTVAARLATDVIREFHAQAKLDQKDLASAVAANPKLKFPTGSVSRQQFDAIVKNGILNDVSACLFIRARANEAQGNLEAAKKDLRSCAALTLGRVWDPGPKNPSGGYNPRGWFWSPARAAKAALEDMAP